MSRPVAVAITGGIGAGKSEALAAFARHGAATLSADAVVHDLIAADPEVRAALRARFGSTDRADIGRVVFADEAALKWLEQLLHPRVGAIQRGWLETVEAPVAVVEVHGRLGGQHRHAADRIGRHGLSGRDGMDLARRRRALGGGGSGHGGEVET